MAERRRLKQELPLQERLALFAKNARKKASLLPPGSERDELLRKADQAVDAAELAALTQQPPNSVR